MLEEIGSLERISWAVARAKDKKDAFRLMGFGHRVYKSFDPRARVMRRVAHEVLEHLNIRCAYLHPIGYAQQRDLAVPAQCRR